MFREAGRFLAFKYLPGIHRHLAFIEKERNVATSFHTFPWLGPSDPSRAQSWAGCALAPRLHLGMRIPQASSVFQERERRTWLGVTEASL